jgi:hypothetical protein
MCCCVALKELAASVFRLGNSYTLKREAESSSQTLLPIYQILEGCQNHKSYNNDDKGVLCAKALCHTGREINYCKIQYSFSALLDRDEQ